MFIRVYNHHRFVAKKDGTNGKKRPKDDEDERGPANQPPPQLPRRLLPADPHGMRACRAAQGIREPLIARKRAGHPHDYTPSGTLENERGFHMPQARRLQGSTKPEKKGGRQNIQKKTAN